MMAIIENNTAKVQKGDTLTAIAAKTKTTVAAIAKANNITNVNLIKPGQVLVIPGKKTGETPASAVTDIPAIDPVTKPIVAKTAVSTYVEPLTGDTYALYSDGSRELLTKGTKQREAELEKEALAAQKKEERQSAYDLLEEEFTRYGLGALVTPLKDLITSGASPAEFTIKLRESDAYKARFGANAERIKKGLTAINEATYIGLEDQYQEIMRNYGLPASYYSKGDLGVQEGFTNLIANDVSAAELEDRVMTAQQRVLKSNPEVLQAIKDFYGDSITNGDILAYTLNPEKGLEDIKRKVTAAEIGGAAVQAGLNLGRTPEEKALYAARAAELGAAGVSKEQAQQGFQTVAEVAPRGGQLAAMYGESPYTQQTAEQEVFGLGGSVDAARQRRKLVGLERAAFAGQAGAAQGAFARERAGNL